MKTKTKSHKQRQVIDRKKKRDKRSNDPSYPTLNTDSTSSTKPDNSMIKKDEARPPVEANPSKSDSISNASLSQEATQSKSSLKVPSEATISKSHFTTKKVPSNEATFAKSYSAVNSPGPQSTSCLTVGNVIEAAKTMSDCSILCDDCDDSSNQMFAHFPLQIKQEFLRQSRLKKSQLQSSACKRNISNEKNRKMDKLRKRIWRESELLKKNEN
ncbi:unnamed protein product [Owenia fusiformis]|uniref:Uncharacterized protein n=1 Tax=Owenia fusiformis TaxID=6347 RepID=A0A8J1YAJ6_OWEFU|nr:unnamed protein product [Owenia fusiformis]